MVGTIFKTIGFFFICFLFLCIPVKDRTIFDHLFRAGKPVGKIISEGAEAGLQKTQTYGKRLFSNSDPTLTNQDEVRSVHASARKSNAEMKTKIKYQNQDNLDQYSADEENALNQALQEN